MCKISSIDHTSKAYLFFSKEGSFGKRYVLLEKNMNLSALNFVYRIGDIEKTDLEAEEELKTIFRNWEDYWLHSNDATPPYI